MRNWTGTVVVIVLGVGPSACASRAGSRSDGGAPGSADAGTPSSEAGVEAVEPGPGAASAPGEDDGSATAEPNAAVSEADWLRAHDAALSPFVREAASRCAAGEPADCYRLANACEEGMGAPTDMAHAQRIYDQACRAGYSLACERLAALRSWDSGPPKDEALARELLARACDLGQLTACAELGRRFRFGQQAPADPVEAARWYARACGGGLPGACGVLARLRPQLEAVGATPPVVAPATVADPGLRPEQACPVRFHVSSAEGGGPNLSGLARIPGVDLLPAVPESIAGWELQPHRGSWNSGEAGTLASGARADYRAGDRSVSLGVYDMHMQCTVQPGTGAVMLAAEPAPAARLPFRAVELAGRPARLVEGPETLSLQLWIADRCEVGATATPPATEDDLRTVLGALDFALLDRLCAIRELADR